MDKTEFDAQQIARELRSALSQAVIDAMLAADEDVSDTGAYKARLAEVQTAYGEGR